MPGKVGSTRAIQTGMRDVPMPPDPEWYPEGSIILPELRSDKDVPDADVFLKRYLGELGLLAGSE
jgi:hypothetical protein